MVEIGAASGAAAWRTGLKRKGVTYDVGTVYAGRLSTRPVFDAAVTRRELGIIKDDLHCNAVRIRGQDAGRLMTAAKAALGWAWRCGCRRSCSTRPRR